jgi:hypothetical protein
MKQRSFHLVEIAQLSAAFPGMRKFFREAWAEWDRMSDTEREETVIGEFLAERDLTDREREKLNRQAEEINVWDSRRA